MNYDAKTLRLPAGQFIDQPCEKDLIVLHHTVGGSARSTFDYWKTDPRRVGTAFLIDRDGTVYETFPPDRWAYHLGLEGAASAGGKHERRSIGIEICSEGGLIERHGDLYCFGVESPRTKFNRDMAESLGYEWRGFRYFDKYEPAQIEAVTALVDSLLARFPSIPRRTLRDHRTGPSGKAVPGPYTDRLSYRGVLGHSDMRADKSDPHPNFPWFEMARRLRLEIDP